MPYIEERPVTQQQPPIWTPSSDCVFTLTSLGPSHRPVLIHHWAIRHSPGSTDYNYREFGNVVIEVHRGQITEYTADGGGRTIRARSPASRIGNVKFRAPSDFEMYSDEDANQLVWEHRSADITYTAGRGTEIGWSDTERQAAGKYRVEAGHPPGCTTTWRLPSNTKARILRNWLSTTRNNVTLTAGYTVGPSGEGRVIDIKAPSDHHWALYEVTNAERLNMAARRAA